MTINDRINLTKARLMRYREAENAILSAQSYSIEGMNLTRADLSTVQKIIAELERELARLERAALKTGRSRMRMIVPLDSTRSIHAGSIL